jgi:hypothetical protein
MNAGGRCPAVTAVSASQTPLPLPRMSRQNAKYYNCGANDCDGDRRGHRAGGRAWRCIEGCVRAGARPAAHQRHPQLEPGRALARTPYLNFNMQTPPTRLHILADGSRPGCQCLSQRSLHHDHTGCLGTMRGLHRRYYTPLIHKNRVELPKLQLSAPGSLCAGRGWEKRSRGWNEVSHHNQQRASEKTSFAQLNVNGSRPTLPAAGGAARVAARRPVCSSELGWVVEPGRRLDPPAQGLPCFKNTGQALRLKSCRPSCHHRLTYIRTDSAVKGTHAHCLGKGEGTRYVQRGRGGTDTSRAAVGAESNARRCFDRKTEAVGLLGLAAVKSCTEETEWEGGWVQMRIRDRSIIVLLANTQEGKGWLVGWSITTTSKA